MLRFLSSLLLLGALFFAWQRLEPFITAPCSEPITYTIGSFDRRFDVTQKNFLIALSEAETIWEPAIGKELFVYSPENGDLKVNLVYDYRQEATEELSELESVVEEDEAAYRALEGRYKALKAEHGVLKSAYDRAVAEFNAHTVAYESNVERWNNGSRTNRQEFEELEAERRRVEAELSAFKPLENQLNSSVKEVNALVSRLNTLARTLNLNVGEYNTIGAERGETFTGGLYTRDALGERIDIFEFENHQKLVRVLAHELGHALGLEHVEDKEAIMYKLNEGKSGTLTQADLTALKSLCQIN